MSRTVFTIGGEKIGRGETRDIFIKTSETYTGIPVNLLVHVIRAKKAGPAVFLTGAVHGDELTGVGVIRELMLRPPDLTTGTLVCVPVANIFGFERHERLLPDRRDLNRCFPGSEEGSLGFRLAHTIFHEVIAHSDYGIDLHSAALRRTNIPHIRADLTVPGMEAYAFSFGCELVLHTKGHENTLRFSASKNKKPTILYEAGEVFKFEPRTVSLGVRGVRNVLKYLDMLDGPPEVPTFQTVVEKTVWVRSDHGGILRFHVRPGDIVEKDAEIARCEKFYSSDVHSIRSPVTGLVLGMTTLPAIKPGEPVCHVAIPKLSMDRIRNAMEDDPKTLHRRVQRDLATNIKLEKKE